METIKQISIELIDPHPENPRKNLGNLTELAGQKMAEAFQDWFSRHPEEF